MTKRELYVTGKATIACAHFAADDYVSVNYYGQDQSGTHWYEITTTQNGSLDHPVMYPEHHLTELCL
jgi:hypothetical protein